MTKAERQAVTAALCKLATATSGQELDPKRIVVYLGGLDAYDAPDVIRAVDSLAFTSRFFPSLAEVIEAIEFSAKLVGAEAWCSAMRAVAAGPDRRDGMVSDDVRETVRLVGGWGVLGTTPTDRLHYVERKFLELLPHVTARSAAAEVRITDDGDAPRRVESDAR